MTTWTAENNPIKAKRHEMEDRWANMPVHPAAEKLDKMSDAEIAELAKDIKANGLQVPFVVLRDNSAAPKGDKGPYKEYLLDGRCRREALKQLGIKHPNAAPTGQGGHEEKVRYYDLLKEVMTLGSKTTWETNVDPDAFVLSLNVHRRHLTAKQRLAVIKALIKADPTRSNTGIAQQTGSDRSTVIRARREAIKNDEINENEHLPIERAKTVLRDTSLLSLKEIMAKANVSLGTAQKARKELVESGEIQPPGKPGPKPKSRPDVPAPKPKPAAPKPSAAEKAAARKAEQITADISAFAVLALGLRDAAKKLGKHSLTETQCATIEDIIKDTVIELRTIPTTTK